MLIHIRSIHYKLIRQESCPSKWIRCLQFFSLFNCPLTPWVRDLWVEGLVGWQFNSAFWGIPLALTGRIEVIKWRRTRGAYRMAAHLDRSIPSSSMPFSLYKSSSLPFISLLSAKIYDQCEPVILVKEAQRPPGATVIFILFTTHFQLVSPLLLPFKFLFTFWSLYCRQLF